MVVLRVETYPFNMTAGFLVLNGRNLEGPIPICAINASAADGLSALPETLFCEICG
jgi:hypothetical protein